jgi:hypothetical protein
MPFPLKEGVTKGNKIGIHFKSRELSPGNKKVKITRPWQTQPSFFARKTKKEFFSGRFRNFFKTGRFALSKPKQNLLSRFEL